MGHPPLVRDEETKRRRDEETKMTDADADGADWPPERPIILVPNAPHPMYPTVAEWVKMKGSVSVANEEILRRRIERARADIDEYTEKLNWLESLPVEPKPGDDNDGPVIFFRKSYGNVERFTNGTAWQYCAVYVSDADYGQGAWFVTGGNKVGLNHVKWRELIAFIFMHETAETNPVIWVATGWEQL
jgi:hypothetical protein